MKKFFIALAISTTFLSCEDDDQPVAGNFKGEEATFQHGKAWTFTELDNAGKPVKLGVTINAAAMQSLDTSHPGGGGHSHANSLSLDFASKSADIPFIHALVDWNPHGHEPAGLYDKPHFDFHFYLTNETERLAIPTYDVDSTKFLNVPGAEYMPAMYINIPGGVPQMGKHWIDVTSGEFGPQGFTQTFIYGTYNGKVNFYEPMITKQFIDANPTFQRSIPAPVKYHKSGYYPTVMKIKTEGGSVTVTLENFVYRTAS